MGQIWPTACFCKSYVICTWPCLLCIAYGCVHTTIAELSVVTSTVGSTKPRMATACPCTKKFPRPCFNGKDEFSYIALESEICPGFQSSPWSVMGGYILLHQTVPHLPPSDNPLVMRNQSLWFVLFLSPPRDGNPLLVQSPLAV